MGDHDFTRSVLFHHFLFILTPDDVEDSWYTGQVMVALKETAFEPSNPMRHEAELQKIFEEKGYHSKPICFVYCDGGPDHRLTYVCVHTDIFH